MEMRFIKTFFALIALVLAVPAAVSAQARLIVTARGSEFGEPLYNVRVTVLLDNEKADEIVAECRTDLSGGCVMTVAPSRLYLVHASLANYETDLPQVTLPRTGDNRLSITLYPPGPPMPPRETDRERVVEGTIVGSVRSLTDEPIAGISVEALRNGISSGLVRSGEDGSFLLRLLPGTYTVRSSTTFSVQHKPGYLFEAAAYGAPLVVTSGNVTGPVLLYPSSLKLASVNVSVVTAAGAPVSGAAVTDRSRWNSSSGTIVGSSGTRISRADGVVLIPAVVPGTLTLTATAVVQKEPLAGIETVEVGNAPLDVTIRLGPAAQATGRVEFVGRSRPLHGLGGLRVESNPGPSAVSTDPNGLVGPDGDFVLKGLAGEQCLVLRGLPSGWRLAEITQYGRPLENKPLLFLQGQTESGIVFRVEETAEVRPPPTPPCAVSNQ